MNEFHNNWRGFMKESSLTRLHQHTQEHDTAIITAYRNNPFSDPNNYCAQGIPDTGQDKGSINRANIARNRELHARLLGFNRMPSEASDAHKDYGVTKIVGTYVENYGDSEKEVEVKEVSFFVTNLKDSPEFIQDVTDLGEEYCQDSVAIIPQGGQGAYLVGTNHSDFPGYAQTLELGDYKPGVEAEFMSKIRNRPFTLGEVKNMETYKDLSMNAKWVVAKITERAAKKPLKENLSDYTSAYEPGKLRLFHYTTAFRYNPVDSFELDPAYFTEKGRRYTRADRELSKYPRSFFYLDPERKEPTVTGQLYVADVPLENIYNLSSDPDGYIGKHSHPTYGLKKYDRYTDLLKDIDENYDGIYYTIGGIPIVAYFEPIEVTKVEETD